MQWKKKKKATRRERGCACQVNNRAHPFRPPPPPIARLYDQPFCCPPRKEKKKKVVFSLFLTCAPGPYCPGCVFSFVRLSFSFRTSCAYQPLGRRPFRNQMGDGPSPGSPVHYYPDVRSLDKQRKKGAFGVDLRVLREKKKRTSRKAANRARDGVGLVGRSARASRTQIACSEASIFCRFA